MLKDLFTTPKTKGEFFWKGFLIGCMLGIIALWALFV